MDKQHRKQRILIVDDTAENIDILINILKEEYRLVAAKHGEKAIQIATSENPPDLILLDIMMPGMDGYEVCEKLKALERTKDIPVIFITSLHETQDETKGFEVGGLDYITKPVSPSVVKARVKTHLQLKESYQKVQAIKNELEEEHRQAEEVGKALLDAKPHSNTMDFALLSAPCSKTCGDRAGFLLESDNNGGKMKSWITVFDASGHGKGAAKFQEVALGSLLGLVKNGVGIKDALVHSNALLESLNTGRFIVGNVWRIMSPEEKEPEKGSLWVEEYNLAQNPVFAFHRDEGGIHEWKWGHDSGSTAPMGIYDDGFEEIAPQYRSVKKGTRIVTYTDGITEALNHQGDLFGSERFQEELIRTRNLPPREAEGEITQALLQWVCGNSENSLDHEQVKALMSDDITFIIADV